MLCGFDYLLIQRHSPVGPLQVNQQIVVRYLMRTMRLSLWVGMDDKPDPRHRRMFERYRQIEQWVIRWLVAQRYNDGLHLNCPMVCSFGWERSGWLVVD
jgi:hypothetical protein